jgi:acyl-CoA thioesterase YciA
MSDEPRGELTIRVMAMPADTNHDGDVFGGWVMAQMDLAGGIAATNRCLCRATTVAVHAMAFIQPVKVGDILCVHTEVLKVGRTSMHIRIEAWARRSHTQLRTKVTEAEFIYVALGEDGHPTPVDRGPVDRE